MRQGVFCQLEKQKHSMSILNDSLTHSRQLVEKRRHFLRKHVILRPEAKLITLNLAGLPSSEAVDRHHDVKIVSAFDTLSQSIREPPYHMIISSKGSNRIGMWSAVESVRVDGMSCKMHVTIIPFLLFSCKEESRQSGISEKKDRRDATTVCVGRWTCSFHSCLEMRVMRPSPNAVYVIWTTV